MEQVYLSFLINWWLISNHGNWCSATSVTSPKFSMQVCLGGKVCFFLFGLWFVFITPSFPLLGQPEGSYISWLLYAKKFTFIFSVFIFSSSFSIYSHVVFLWFSYVAMTLVTLLHIIIGYLVLYACVWFMSVVLNILIWVIFWYIIICCHSCMYLDAVMLESL